MISLVNVNLKVLSYWSSIENHERGLSSIECPPVGLLPCKWSPEPYKGPYVRQTSVGDTCVAGTGLMRLGLAL